MKRLALKSQCLILITTLLSLQTQAQSLVMSDCDADFEVGSQELTADGWLVHFNNTSEAEGGIGDVIWDFGDGSVSTEFEPAHVYAVAGEYEVCIIITNETGTCTDDRCDHFDVGELDGECEADWDYDDDGLTVNFTNDSESDAGDIVSYNWNFGDGAVSTDEDPVHEYAVSGEYEVCLSIITADGCYSSFCDDVDVEGSGTNCSAFFSVVSITSADGGFTVAFDNETSGGVSGGETPYLWDFDDASPIHDGEDPDHFFAAAGTYVVCLVVGEEGTDCYDQYCSEIVLTDAATSINTLQQLTDIIAYPNPATDILHLKTQQAQTGELKLRDMPGNILFEAEINSGEFALPVNGFNAGTYILQYQTANGIYIKQIIIQ